MSARFKPNTTVACVIYSQGKFLLVEELINNEVKFNQPAGHLEANESIIDACIREVLEETGLAIIPQALVGIYQYSASADLAFVRYTFCVELAEQQTARPLDSSIIRNHWLNVEEITSIESQLRSPLVLKSIGDFLQQAGLLNNESSVNSSDHIQSITPIERQSAHYPLSIINADYL